MTAPIGKLVVDFVSNNHDVSARHKIFISKTSKLNILSAAVRVVLIYLKFREFKC